MLQAESVVCKHKSISHFTFQRENAQFHFPMLTDGYPPGITKRSSMLVILLVLDVGWHPASLNALPYTNGYITFEVAMYYLAFFIKLFSSIKGGGEEGLLHLLKAFYACKAKLFFQPFYKGGRWHISSISSLQTPPLPPLKASLKKVKVPIVGDAGCLWWSKGKVGWQEKTKQSNLSIKMVSSHNIWFDFYYLCLFRFPSSYINKFLNATFLKINLKHQRLSKLFAHTCQSFCNFK